MTCSFSLSLRDQAGQTRASSSRTDDGEPHLSPVCSVTSPWRRRLDGHHRAVVARADAPVRCRGMVKMPYFAADQNQDIGAVSLGYGPTIAGAVSD